MKPFPTATLVALAFAPTVLAAQSDILALCLETSNMDEALCTCVAGKAGELTEEQQGLIAAMLSGNDAEADRLRGGMPVSQMMVSSTFMVHAPTDCAKEMSGISN